jgi:hypothetical protein
MEMNNQNSKRKRKIIQKEPVLIRSVKPGQTSVPAWQKETSSASGLWKVNTSAA